MPSGATGELELDLGPPGSGPGDPFASESPFGAALDPPAPPAPRRPSAPSPLDSMELGSPGGSSSFTSDPVNVQASVDVPAGALKADPVQVTVPVEITLSSGGREVLVPIRLQLKIRIR